MAHKLKIAIWNANDLCQHAQEINLFLHTFQLDILLVSETLDWKEPHENAKLQHISHHSPRRNSTWRHRSCNQTKHHARAEYKQNNVQATSISLEDNIGEITISAIYWPPKHKNKYEDYVHFFKTLGNRFLVGGDFNAKHTFWGSRLTNTKGRELFNVLQYNNI